MIVLVCCESALLCSEELPDMSDSSFYAVHSRVLGESGLKHDQPLDLQL